MTIKTEHTCSNCGLPLDVSCKNAVNNNCGELDYIEVFMKPCVCAVETYKAMERMKERG